MSVKKIKCYVDDWEEKCVGQEISHTLLWEYNMDNFDWEYMKRVVIERVIERGTMEDIYAMIAKYGGLEKVREDIKQLPYLTDRGMCFACGIFDIKKKEMRCYHRKIEREKLLNS